MARPAPPTFADACERLLQDPDGDHSQFTTLAPLYNRMQDDATLDSQFEAVQAFAPESGQALDLGCGVGGLLSRLDGRYDRAVGVDRHPELLRFTPHRAPSADALVGDPADPPVTGAFDAVVALGNLTAHLPESELDGFFEVAAAHLDADGTLLLDAIVDAGVLRSDGIGVFRGSGYRLERSVTDLPAGGDVDLQIDYRATDEHSGASAMARETMRVCVHDGDRLRAAAKDAGLDDVRLLSADEADGSVLLVARGSE